MARGIRRIRWYAAGACALAITGASSGVALAQTQGGPAHHSAHGSSGPGYRLGADGGFVPASGTSAPPAPPGSTVRSHQGSGGGKTTGSYGG